MSHQFVSITRLRVGSLRDFPLFLRHAMRTIGQATTAEGAAAVSTRFEAGLVVWTMTVWDDAEAMRRYRNSGAHQIAMRLLSDICSEASYVHWEQPAAAPPDWGMAHRRLLAEGKLSKVRRPSVMQQAGAAAPPRPRRGFVPPTPPLRPARSTGGAESS